MEKSKQDMSANPREKANIFSVLSFWWTMALFKKGYSKELGQEDLFRPLKEDTSESLGDRLDKKWATRKSSKSRTRLIRAIARTFWFDITRLGVIQVLNEVVIRLGQPLLLGRLLQTFRSGSDDNREEALMCAGGIVILNALSILTINQFTFGGFHLGMRVRVAVCSIIYRKALRLSRIALGDTAPGKVVNLLSNDVNRFDMLSIFLHFMWSAPLVGLVVTYLLWMEIGLPGIFGVIVVSLVVPIQSYTGKLSSRFRLQTALKTDERVRLMDEVISGVQVIKMYAWEKPYSLLVGMARKLELKIVRKSAYVRGLYMTFMLFTTRMALFCTLLAIVLMGGQLTAAKVFVVSSYFNILAQTMSQMFVRGFAEIAEAWVAMDRLQRFLDYDEFRSNNLHIGVNLNRDKASLVDENKLNGNGNLLDMNAKNQKNVIGDFQQIPLTSGDSVAKLSNIIASWTNDATNEPTLSSITLEVPKGKLIGVIGSVGAGKSSLLQLLLGELPAATGDMTVSGIASYACQEPWVFASSVRQNILFGQPFEKSRYNEVIKSCALQQDFAQLPDGDLTIVGERGASLSGGQRARVSLARAVYRRADLYLLDDPLSAVDAHVGRHLFDRCIGPKGTLSGHTRVLVTHQVHYLNGADWIVVMNNGSIEAQGTPQDLSKSGIDIVELIHKGDNEEAKQDPYARRLSKTSAKSKISLTSVATHESDSEQEEDALAGPQPTVETTSKGVVQGSVLAQYFKAGANSIILVPMFALFILTQVAASAADYWVSYWTAQEELRQYYNSTKNDLFSGPTNDSMFDFETTTDFPEFRINSTSVDPSDSLLSTETCIYVHGGIVAALFLIAITRSLTFYSICIRASQNLHDMMFQGIIKTTMRFFDTNPSGRIMNRFSKDMGAIDEYLPKAILDASQIILWMVGSIILTATVNPWFLVPVAGLGVIFVFVRRIYLKTSKNIKRLEGITRSPVFSHLAASLAGLSTVRAFGAQNVLISEFDAHQDLHSAAWYMFIATSTAFGLSLDILCLIFVCLVTFSFLISGQERPGDQVGLAITQAMALTGLMQWGIRQSAEVANQMMSVERVLEYRSLPPEPEAKDPREPARDWPEKGIVKFDDMSLSYVEGDEPVLRHLDIEIREKEKVGIVGRTGAGKSSLIAALFRLAPMEGSILIDGIDTATIKLNDLRSKVSIIPQDPVLFSGTLRRNLDPFEEYPDSAIWTALHEVELGDIGGGLLGLQAPVLAGGSNFSVGQRQLLCLARAILRENKILVLDEATANVDPQTDTLIQRTIRSRFADCTVLTVAHRLHTVMDSDRVLVMDGGQVAEFASPEELLRIRDGIFRSMVEQSGRQETELLIAIAKEAAEKNRSRSSTAV